jgi:hypothetical protein
MAPQAKDKPKSTVNWFRPADVADQPLSVTSVHRKASKYGEQWYVIFESEGFGGTCGISFSAGKNDDRDELFETAKLTLEKQSTFTIVITEKPLKGGKSFYLVEEHTPMMDSYRKPVGDDSEIPF